MGIRIGWGISYQDIQLTIHKYPDKFLPIHHYFRPYKGDIHISTPLIIVVMYLYKKKE